MDVAAFLFAVANIAALTASLLAAQTISPGRERWHCVVAAISSYGILVNATMLVLGLCGVLTPYYATAATVLIALAFLMIRYLGPQKSQAFPTAPRPPPRSDHSPLAALAFMLLAGTFGVQLVQAAFDATILKWDDLSYHAAVTAQWLVDERISIPPSTYQAYYPFSSELLSLWFMLPFGSDAYASLAGLYWLLLGSVSIFGIIRGTGSTTATASLITAVFVASPRILELSRSFSSNDIAGTSLILAAFALAIPTSSYRDGRIALASSGLLIGMAIGSKVTFLIPGILVLAWAMLRGPRMVSRASRWYLLVLIAGPGLLIGGYWYIRNWVLTGNPLYPAEFGPIPGPFDAASQSRTMAWSWILQGAVPKWQFAKLLNWPYPTGFMALAGYIFIFHKLVSANRQSNLASDGIDYALFLTGLLALAIYPFMPFSGTINRPDAGVSLDSRYIVIFFVIGLILYRHILLIHGHWRLLGYILPFTALSVSISDFGFADAVVLIVFCIFGFLIFRLIPKSNAPWLISTAVASALLVALGTFHTAKLKKTSDALYSYDGPQKNVGKAWQELERLPANSSIAFFMSEPEEYSQHYPIFGRHLQFQPAYVDAEGKARKPMHERSGKELPSWWGDWDKGSSGQGRRTPSISGQQLVNNLLGAGADFVLSSRWSLGHWPPQHYLLQEAPQAVEMFNDGYSALWRLLPPLYQVPCQTEGTADG